MVQGQALRLGKQRNAKFQRCVDKVKSNSGKSVGQAHAICNKTVGRGKKQKK